MSTLTPRRTPKSAVIAFLVATAALLAGCAADSYEPASSDPYTYSGGDAGYAEDGFYSEGEPSAFSMSLVVERAIIITGALYITVEDPIAAADQAAGIVQRAGGRIDARSENAPDERSGGSAALTLRIPSSKLDAAVRDLRELGAVEHYTTDSYDVDAEVTDLAARISTLRASTQRIEALLVDAKDITDIIKLENELAGRQAELEGLEARQRGLNDQVSMSTIELSLSTEPVEIVKESTGPTTFWDGLVMGWDGLVGFLSVALVVIGVVLPWLALMAVIILAVVIAIRTSLSRRARRRGGAAVPPAVPAQPAPTPAPPA